MKSYEFEHVTYTTHFASYSLDENITEIIRGYAEIGYRYVGYIPLSMTSYGALREIELIFEKDED